MPYLTLQRLTSHSFRSLRPRRDFRLSWPPSRKLSRQAYACDCLIPFFRHTSDTFAPFKTANTTSTLRVAVQRLPSFTSGLDNLTSLLKPQFAKYLSLCQGERYDLGFLYKEKFVINMSTDVWAVIKSSKG